jgi:leucyl aminopeptidase
MPTFDLPLAPTGTAALPLRALRPAGLEAFLAARPPAEAAFLRASGFAAKAGDLVLLPGAQGVAGAVFGLGDDRSPHRFGELPFRLPEGSVWRLEDADEDDEAAVLLGWCLGGYRYRALKTPPREPARLAPAAAHPRAQVEAEAIWMVRDLINTPANLLGPAELAEAALSLARDFGAAPLHVAGADLARDYPTVAAVGAGSARAPVVAGFEWRGSAAGDTSPLIALVGKGVCFDTGGYDLKPADGMLRMKKDMGGAAIVLGIARVLMHADLPVRLMVRIGCVENSVSGTAMRPSDVVRTRRGLTVEIGNTDAEGRLVLADLLAEASDAKPAVLLDIATLTGAARVALGPDIPAMFCTDDGWAEAFHAAGGALHDPVWRLPLWDGYDEWLKSAVADVNNVSAKSFAGSITAALFLRRFLAPQTTWIHLDAYAWNDATRPGRPEGGEAQALRVACAALAGHFNIVMQTGTPW